MTPAQAVHYAFNTVGMALFETTAVLAAGFMVLAFSGFQINADVGMMTVSTLVIALSLDFLLLPTLLMKADCIKTPSSSPPQHILGADLSAAATNPLFKRIK